MMRQLSLSLSLSMHEHNQQQIVVTGGRRVGKTVIINELEAIRGPGHIVEHNHGQHCHEGICELGAMCLQGAIVVHIANTDAEFMHALQRHAAGGDCVLLNTPAQPPAVVAAQLAIDLMNIDYN